MSKDQSKNAEGLEELPAGFVPGDHDVVIGKFASSRVDHEHMNFFAMNVETNIFLCCFHNFANEMS